ncbi:hypothetical protein BBP40_004654 [Aspergillus hancockii]|nr:hypothetical protein BBP40_004654 [Aspergillus hancockii]
MATDGSRKGRRPTLVLKAGGDRSVSFDPVVKILHYDAATPGLNEYMLQSAEQEMQEDTLRLAGLATGYSSELGVSDEETSVETGDDREYKLTEPAPADTSPTFIGPLARFLGTG